jgi:hypothetical protein
MEYPVSLQKENPINKITMTIQPQARYENQQIIPNFCGKRESKGEKEDKISA